MINKRAIERLTDSINEAERFLDKAKIAKLRIESNQESSYNSKSFAAAKRASLDLSRLLVILRKSLFEY
jgi:hypothetical protein